MKMRKRKHFLRIVSKKLNEISSMKIEICLYIVINLPVASNLFLFCFFLNFIFLIFQIDPKTF